MVHEFRKLVTGKEIVDLVQPFWRRKLEHASKKGKKDHGIIYNRGETLRFGLKPIGQRATEKRHVSAVVLG